MGKLLNTIDFDSINGHYRFYIYEDKNPLPKYRLVKINEEKELTVNNIYEELRLLNEELHLEIDYEPSHRKTNFNTREFSTKFIEAMRLKRMKKEISINISVYNKLVRDRIPQIIEASGKTCTTRILDPSEHLHEIKTKMQEEALEFQQAANDKDAIEELADILELVHAALDVYGVSFDVLEEVRQHKKDKRGGFAEGIYLIEVED